MHGAGESVTRFSSLLVHHPHSRRSSGQGGDFPEGIGKHDGGFRRRLRQRIGLGAFGQATALQLLPRLEFRFCGRLQLSVLLEQELPAPLQDDGVLGKRYAPHSAHQECEEDNSFANERDRIDGRKPFRGPSFDRHR